MIYRVVAYLECPRNKFATYVIVKRLIKLCQLGDISTFYTLYSHHTIREYINIYKYDFKL